MACDRCGQPTPRSKLCKRCEQMERREGDLQAARERGESDQVPDELLVYECSACGEEFTATELTTCPECGNDRVRCLGQSGEGVTC